MIEDLWAHRCHWLDRFAGLSGLTEWSYSCSTQDSTRAELPCHAARRHSTQRFPSAERSRCTKLCRAQGEVRSEGVTVRCAPAGLAANWEDGLFSRKPHARQRGPPQSPSGQLHRPPSFQRSELQGLRVTAAPALRESLACWMSAADGGRGPAITYEVMRVHHLRVGVNN